MLSSAIIGLSLITAGPLTIHINPDPVSICDGTLSAIAQRARNAQPTHYVDPKEFGTDHDAYLQHPRPSALFDSSGIPLVEVTKLKEIRSTYLLFFSERLIMNYAFNRASSAIEGNSYLNDQELLNSPHLTKVAGHDLTSDQLKAFYDLWLAPQQSQSRKTLTAEDQKRLSAEEQIWNQWLLPLIEQAKEPFTVLTAAAHPLLINVASHEGRHAEFFQDPEKRQAAIDFYEQKVPADDKEIYLDALADYENIGNDPKLQANEFYAYIQQSNAEESLSKSRFPHMRPLARLVPKYRQPMREFFKSRGLLLQDFVVDVR